MTPLESLVACGTKLWLDSVDPTEVAKNLDWAPLERRRIRLLSETSSRQVDSTNHLVDS